METLIRDLRYALRQLRRRPGFALVGALSLGVGIAAVTAVFSLVNGLFLRTPPGVQEPGRLVSVDATVASYPNFRDLRAASAPALELAAFYDDLVGLEADGRSRQVLGLFVSPDYFRTLGTRPALGRLLDTPGDEGAPARREVVVSHRAWRRHFAGDTGIVGRSVRVNGTPLTVVGVAEEGFHGSFVGFQFDLWIPVQTGADLGTGVDLDDRATDRLELVGRMREGVEPERVRAALETTAAGLRRRYPRADGDLEVNAHAYTGIDEEVRRPALALSGVLLAVAILVLLVATANVTGMQLARSVARSRDTALRLALGGETRHVAGPVVAESLAVAVLGGALGVAIVWWIEASLRDLIPELPVQLALRFPVDARVLAVAALVTVLGGLGASLLPALRARRVHLAVLLLATAGTFVVTLATAGTRDPGFRTEGVLVAPFLDLSADGDGLEVDVTAVWPGFFTTLGIPVVRGRSFVADARDRRPPEAVAAPVRAAVAEVEPRLPAPELQSLEGFLDVSLVPQRLAAKIGGTLGLLSLLLAGVGLYAMVGFWVSRRTRAIGIRVAVGADPGAVYRSVVARGARLAGWGTALGLLLAVVGTRFLGSAVAGVSPAGPAVLGGVAVVILVAVVTATAVPARRAAAVDPVESLRAE